MQLRKYSQALRGVQVGQGNPSVPEDTKNKKVEFICGTNGCREDPITWKKRQTPRFVLCEVNISLFIV